MNYTDISNTRLCFVMPDSGDIIDTTNVSYASRQFSEGKWLTAYDINGFNPDLIEILFELGSFTIYEISEAFNEQLNKTETFCVKLESATINEYNRYSSTVVNLFIRSVRPSHIAVDLVPREVRKKLS